MKKQPILKFIRKITSPVFTTREASHVSGKSLSATTQALNNLEKSGIILKVYRGIWRRAERQDVSPYTLIASLFPMNRAYVSFTSALHLHGIIEQIPQVVTLASTTHSRIIRTALGDYQVHRITPSFFDGFSWYREKGEFLIASPEKALADSLYLSACKKKQYGYFPELHFSKSFSFKEVDKWAEKISNKRIRSNVIGKLKTIIRK
ncbi:MAG: type IV toxin-antitoxin system AbiEi family antitoxin domain-containing protein [Elusimicrobiota bacterium]